MKYRYARTSTDDQTTALQLLPRLNAPVVPTPTRTGHGTTNPSARAPERPNYTAAAPLAPFRPPNPAHSVAATDRRPSGGDSVPAMQSVQVPNPLHPSRHCSSSVP